jgi:dihydrofolate reductase
MGKVIYWMNTSIDGYIEDPDGGMDFLDLAEDFQQAANDHVRRAAAFLFGRRLYEAMEKPWTQDLGKEGARPSSGSSPSSTRRRRGTSSPTPSRPSPKGSRSSVARTPCPW